jgi:hypothetical protein
MKLTKVKEVFTEPNDKENLSQNLKVVKPPKV